MPDERREFWALNAYREEERKRGREKVAGEVVPLSTLFSQNIGLQLPVIISLSQFATEHIHVVLYMYVCMYRLQMMVWLPQS